MNLHTKFNRNRRKGKYSKIRGTEMEEQKDKNPIFRSVFQNIITFFPSQILTFRKNVRAVIGEYCKGNIN